MVGRLGRIRCACRLRELVTLTPRSAAGTSRTESGWRLRRHPAEKPPDRRAPLHSDPRGAKKHQERTVQLGAASSPSRLPNPLARSMSCNGAGRIGHLVGTRSLQPLFPASSDSVTGTGATFQISWQYSAMARSEENGPIRAVFRMDRRVQAAGS